MLGGKPSTYYRKSRTVADRNVKLGEQKNILQTGSGEGAPKGRGRTQTATNENIKTLHSFHSFIWSLGFCRPDDYYIHNFCCSFRVVVERALLMLKCLSSSPFLYVASVSFLRPRTNFARNSPNQTPLGKTEKALMLERLTF